MRLLLEAQSRGIPGTKESLTLVRLLGSAKRCQFCSVLHLPCGQKRTQIGGLANSDSSIRNVSATNTDDSDEVDALAIRVSEILSQLNRPQQNFTSSNNLTGPASIPCEIQSRVPWEGRKVPFKQIKER